MIPEKAKSEIIRKHAMGETWTAIRNWLEEEYGVKVHRTTISRWHAKEVYSRPIREEEDIEIEVNLSEEDRIKLDKKVVTHQAEAKYFKKMYEKVLKENTRVDLIIEAIKDYAPAFKSQPKIKYLKPKGKVRGKSPVTAIAPLTDTHVGDVVRADQMLGLNAYDIDIFNKRLYGWAEQVLNLTNFQRTHTEVTHLIIPMLGDMISGDIHDELARTNADNNLGQMIRGANLIAQALMYLAPHYEEIKVPCVVGNHGRMTRKIPAKDKYLDWDYMLYQWVATFCRNQKNIKFEIPKSFAHIFEAANRKFLILHGDSISGSGSLVGMNNSAAKLRGVLQYRKGLEEEVSRLNIDSAAPIGYDFDTVMMGHFHRVDEIDIGTGELFICGTMKGGDEYALNRLHLISKPKQIITWWHPKYGYLSKNIIYLNRYDSSEEAFEDVLPEIWAS